MAGDPKPWCIICDGDGFVRQERVEDAESLPADVRDDVEEFLRAWFLVEKYGPQGALCLLNATEWTEEFVVAMEIFESAMAGAVLEMAAERPKAK